LGDLQGRGLIFYHCLKCINQHRPTLVVFENVMGLKTQHVQELRDILAILASMDYAVTWDCLDALYNGLPQSRPRLYIVAIRNNARWEDFRFPQKLKARRCLDKFLDDNPKPCYFPPTETAKRNIKKGFRKLKAKGLDPATTTAVIDLYAGPRYANCMIGRCPCITATRAQQEGYYLTNQKRTMTVEEMARLQGWPTKYVEVMRKTGISMKQLGHVIGNGMTVSILYRLLPRTLYSAAMVLQPVHAIWKHFDRQQEAAATQLPDDLWNYKV
jgi:DNA (cytosine-5)-methyltransferase 1